MFLSLWYHCSSERLAVQRWGRDLARKIGQRLAELRAAPTLADVFRLPGPRCHELSGQRKEQFTVDLKHPYRLVFEPADDPVPRKQDGGIALNLVTSVRILKVEDYH